ncbi:hypothetical protein [Streptomyces sp. 2A115]|uniref:hypothetical protein n=1 Tax=Streptomyces sp. 2A115 TaxID=3457439 RepID=UPI003FD67543
MEWFVLAPSRGVRAALGRSHQPQPRLGLRGRARPAEGAQAYRLPKVSVDGTAVTVTPTNALGQTFDLRSYTVTP